MCSITDCNIWNRNQINELGIGIRVPWKKIEIET